MSIGRILRPTSINSIVGEHDGILVLQGIRSLSADCPVLVIGRVRLDAPCVSEPGVMTPNKFKRTSSSDLRADYWEIMTPSGALGLVKMDIVVPLGTSVQF